MSAATRRIVVGRAADRYEYCRIHQDRDPFYRFHVEHIIPKQHGGADDETNLALACHHCNLHKGPNLTGIDPQTHAITPLFHPRQQKWEDHFELGGPAIQGRTAVGRTTVVVLAINSPIRLELRGELRSNSEGL